MIVNQLNLTGHTRLNQIMHTLKHVHHFELSAHEQRNLAETQQHYESVKNKIVENSAFNSYHTNPAYTKAALISEAVKLLKEIAPSRRKTVKEHQELAESMHEYKKGDKVTYTDPKTDKAQVCKVVKFTKGPMIGLEINGKMDMVDVKHVNPCGVEESVVSEKWGTEMKTAAKDVGKWEGYTIAELKARKKKLMDKAERSAAEQKEVRQLNFAIRAKQEDSFGKIKKESTLMEDENLDKAETLLAAKDLSDRLQNMAEDAAKMAVDKLMPLVDVMKSQFGQDPADGFNQVVKAQLQTVLDAIIAAKDETDNAIMALQGGETPGMSTDISQPLPSADVGADTGEAMPDVDQEFSAGPETAGPAEEPLGRGRKTAMSESKFAVGDNVEFEYAKNMKPVKGQVVEIVSAKKTSQNPHGYMVDVKSGNTIYSLHPDHPQKLNEAINKPADMADVKAKAAAALLNGGKDPDTNRPVDKQAAQKILNMKEAKRTMQPGAVATAQVKKMGDDYWTGEHLTKKGIRKRDEIIRAIEKDTQAESKVNNLKVIIESLLTEFNNLKHELRAHQETHQQAVMEGSVKDVTQVGYGLEGAAIIHKMTHIKSKIQEAQKRLASTMAKLQEQAHIISTTEKKISALKEQKTNLPYGVIGTDRSGTKFKKFFESAHHRQLWLDYASPSIAHQQIINPEDLERIRARLKGTI